MTSGQQDQAEHRQWDLNSAMHSGTDRERGRAGAIGLRRPCLARARETPGRDDLPCEGSSCVTQSGHRGHRPVPLTHGHGEVDSPYPQNQFYMSWSLQPGSMWPRVRCVSLWDLKGRFVLFSRLRSSRATSAETRRLPACHPARGARTLTPPSPPRPPQSGARQCL